MMGLAADFLVETMLDQKKQECSQSLIVLCIEIPSYLAKEYETSVHDLPPDSDKPFELSHREHKRLLEMFDEEWATYALNQNYYTFRW
jgi:hypothetical protein